MKHNVSYTSHTNIINFMVMVLQILSVTYIYLNDHILIATEFVLAYKSYLSNINSVVKFYGLAARAPHSKYLYWPQIHQMSLNTPIWSILYWTVVNSELETYDYCEPDSEAKQLGWRFNPKSIRGLGVEPAVEDEAPHRSFTADTPIFATIFCEG